MSRKKWIGGLISVALLMFGAQRLSAQIPDVNETCTFAATLIINNTNSTYNTNTTAFANPPPTMVKMATKDLLALLAKAEFNEGYWDSNSFPSGAKLIKDGTFTTGNYVDFFVQDSKGNYLTDCTDILSPGGFEDIMAYTDKGTDNNSTPGSETDYGFVELDIYDLDAGGMTDLQLFGSFVNTIKTTTVNKTTSTIGDSQSITVKTLGGEGAIGNNDNFNCAASGSFSAKGSAQTF